MGATWVQIALFYRFSLFSVAKNPYKSMDYEDYLTLGVKGSQVRILSFRPYKKPSDPTGQEAFFGLDGVFDLSEGLFGDLPGAGVPVASCLSSFLGTEKVKP